MHNEQQMRLKEGITAARLLGAETDRLTEELAQIERAIHELHLGVSARVSMSDGRMLAFEKESKIWRLRVHTHDTVLLLINASRGLRLEAVEHLPALLEALVDEAERQLTVTTTVHKRAEEFLTGLRRFIQTQT
jgi:hypothetical protein